MKTSNFSDPLTFHLAPSSGENLELSKTLVVDLKKKKKKKNISYTDSSDKKPKRNFVVLFKYVCMINITFIISVCTSSLSMV